MANEIDVRLRDKIDKLTRKIRIAQAGYGGRQDAAIREVVNELRAERANLQSYLDARRDARHG